MKTVQQIFVLLLFVQFSCAQKPASSVVPNRKISTQDSIRVSNYLDQVNQASLFSLKRQQYLDSALMIVPWAAQLWQQKAMPLFKQKKYEIGMIYLDSAVKYDKTNHWLEYRAFIKCIFQKSYRESIKDFNLAQKLNGNSYVMDHSYEFYKGLCYLQLNRIDSAEYLIGKVITEELKAHNEAHRLHWFYKGIIQYEKENYFEAIKSFDSSLQQYSQFSDAQFYKAMCLMEQKEFKQALELLRTAKENLSLGYTLNEDNAIYEGYPYQLNKSFLDAMIENFDQVSQKD